MSLAGQIFRQKMTTKMCTHSLHYWRVVWNDDTRYERVGTAISAREISSQRTFLLCFFAMSVGCCRRVRKGYAGTCAIAQAQAQAQAGAAAFDRFGRGRPLAFFSGPAAARCELLTRRSCPSSSSAATAAGLGNHLRPESCRRCDG